MKKWIALVELLTLCCAMVNVIPYPKMVEEGTEVLKVPLCEIHPVFGENTNQEMKDIWEASEEMLLGKGSRCSQGFSILISQSQSGSCKSEKYSLKISSDGISVITECSVGLSRAIATLYQLSQIEGETVVFQNVPISIEDSPRFSHRGIMVDTARHFLQLSILKRIINGMMIAKLNVLHWHLVDDDSFPMESEQIPDLAKKAAFSPNQIYSKQDIQNIVAYAKSKGVRVIPEIDCPGHSIAVGKYEPLNN